MKLTDGVMVEMTEWLNSQGYNFDMSDGLWMESYLMVHKWRDIFELMNDWHHKAAPPVADTGELDRIAIRDAVASCLGDVYSCTRTWNAWGYGTMSQEDFDPAWTDEELLESIVDSVVKLRALPAPQPVARQDGPVKCDGCGGTRMVQPYNFCEECGRL